MNNDLDGWWRFLTLCQKAKTEQELNELFNLFLTAEERQAIADRYLIVRALLQGEKTQRKISAEFNVSIAKITRGSNFLKTISEKLQAFLQKHVK